MSVLETIKLTKPIRSFDKEINNLTFNREPCAGDFAKHGNPVSFNRDQSINVNAASVLRITEACCGLASNSLDAMHPADFMVLQGVVLSFFGAES